MKKRILINARYPEEKRVAIVEGETLLDFYVEVATKEHLKGNIYKGVVVRVEPGLQAAFVDFGPKKHGFLQMREINPEYFQSGEQAKRGRIQDVLAKGKELIVQVEKEERDTKGASLTTFISLPGRYLVMMPGQKRVGISRKIESREDRERLKDAFNALKLPENMGFILRTAGSDKTADELSNDLKYLTKLWATIEKESEKASAPALIYKEQDIAVRTVRDYLTSDIAEVLVDDQAAYKNTKDFLRKTMSWRKINIKYYKESVPILVKYGIEEQLVKINERYVYLPSRGYLVFDKTEALTAIDVNSGRSRKEGNIEATALRTNLEAAEEIARQLRMRDIGGLIMIDFIDMASSKNRREVENKLKSALASDKAHWDTGSISKFGIVEMTRERMRPTYLESIYRKCEACEGSGTVKTDEMVAISAIREIHSVGSKEGAKTVNCTLPVESANYLINNKRDEIARLEKELGIRITIRTDKNILPGRLSVEEESLETVEPAAVKGHGHAPHPRLAGQEHRAEHKPRHEPKRKPEHKPKHEPEHRPEHEPEHKLEHKPKHEPEHKPAAEPERKSEHEPERGPEHEAEHKPEIKPKRKRGGRRGGRRGSRRGGRPEHESGEEQRQEPKPEQEQG